MEPESGLQVIAFLAFPVHSSDRRTIHSAQGEGGDSSKNVPSIFSIAQWTHLIDKLRGNVFPFK